MELACVPDIQAQMNWVVAYECSEYATLACRYLPLQECLSGELQ
jgi:hypothetical protein